MFELLAELEQISQCLKQINSVYICMQQFYFSNAEPDKHGLTADYKDYVNIILALRDMTQQQQETLDSIINKLYEVCTKPD